MFGFYMVALRIRLDTIIPGIIIHWLWDCLIHLKHLSGYSGYGWARLFFIFQFLRMVYGYLETTINTYIVNNYSSSIVEN